MKAMVLWSKCQYRCSVNPLVGIEETIFAMFDASPSTRRPTAACGHYLEVHVSGTYKLWLGNWYMLQKSIHTLGELTSQKYECLKHQHFLTTV